MSDWNYPEEDERVTWWSPNGEEVVTGRIKSFFDNHPKFIWEGTIGAGGNGIVFRLQYRDGGSSSRLALKIAPLDVDFGGYKTYGEDEKTPNEVKSILIEKEWLQKLRGCKHIIQSLDIPPLDDPLLNIPIGMQSHGLRNWIFMEYAENGTLNSFVERHREQYPGELLPCRLLWRFFMCLIRAAIEMAYYDATRDGKQVDITNASLESLKSIPPGPLGHLDWSVNNVIVGALEPHFQPPEHSITPTLKAIDFGEARNVDPETDEFNRIGSERNLLDIGEIMGFLMILGRGDFNDKVKVTVDDKTFEISGGSYIEQNRLEIMAKGVDSLMIGFVYQCLSLERVSRPNLIDLAIKVHDQVVNRGANGVERETDQAILKRISTLILEAETRKRPREEDEDDDDDDEDSEEGRIKRRKIDES
ncbi:hypothetical protein K449DRAFT_441031 [Hypoxylon sp. EC38]|nr:hypothetical protein K449DRAFT_441031 [Hypoxylon sp. EC38]